VTAQEKCDILIHATA